jgi:hypothetical protein
MACASCGQSVTNTSVQGAKITVGGQVNPTNGVRVINSAPMPVAAPTTRRTV